RAGRPVSRTRASLPATAHGYTAVLRFHRVPSGTSTPARLVGRPVYWLRSGANPTIIVLRYVNVAQAAHAWDGGLLPSRLHGNALTPRPPARRCRRGTRLCAKTYLPGTSWRRSSQCKSPTMRPTIGGMLARRPSAASLARSSSVPAVPYVNTG